MECTILHVLAGLDAHSHKPHYTVRPRKKFVSCNGPKKNRVGRLIIKKKIVLFFYSKMCVLCMFYVDWELVVKGRENFRVGIFLSYILLG